MTFSERCINRLTLQFILQHSLQSLAWDLHCSSILVWLSDMYTCKTTLRPANLKPCEAISIMFWPMHTAAQLIKRKLRCSTCCTKEGFVPAGIWQAENISWR